MIIRPYNFVMGYQTIFLTVQDIKIGKINWIQMCQLPDCRDGMAEFYLSCLNPFTYKPFSFAAVPVARNLKMTLQTHVFS